MLLFRYMRTTAVVCSQQLLSIAVFKRRLKTYLFKTAFGLSPDKLMRFWTFFSLRCVIHAFMLRDVYKQIELK
jgi:hypothetical protein